MFRKTPPQKLNYSTEVSGNLWTVCTDYQCLLIWCSCDRASLIWNDIWDQLDATIMIYWQLCPYSGVPDRILLHMVSSTSCCCLEHAAMYGLALLQVGIMVPETCWANGLLINHNCCNYLVSYITLFQRDFYIVIMYQIGRIICDLTITVWRCQESDKHRRITIHVTG